MSLRNINECLKAYYNGDSLSTAELDHLYDHTKEAARLLSAMGDRFRLARNEALHISQVTEQFLRARSDKNFVKNHMKNIHGVG